jgi:hypothetical protein
LADGLTVDGTTNRGATVEYIPGGYAVTTITLEPKNTPNGLSSNEQGKQIWTRVKDLVGGELKELKESGDLNDSYLNLSLNDRNRYVVTILSLSGEKSREVSKLSNLGADISTVEGRAQIWRESLAVLTLDRAVGLIEDGSVRVNNAAVNRIEALQDFYGNSGDLLAQRLAQAILSEYLKVGQSGDPILRYVKLGPITAEEMARFPDNLRLRIEDVNFLARNLPNEIDREIIESRIIGTAIPQYLAGVIELEERAGVITPATAERASLEAKNAIYYARMEFSQLKEPTVEAALWIVRKYFEQDNPSDYRFQGNIGGLALPLCIRRTDCSSRALVAMEMLKAMGFEAGAEVIGADQDGIPQISHMYNFVRTKDEQYTFADFSATGQERFIHENRSIIMERYVGDSGLTARVQLSSSDPGILYGFLIDEPVIDLKREFQEAFKKAGKDLEPFLTDYPEWGDRVEVLRRYSTIKDEIFGTKEGPRWQSGTHESIRALH